jgi:hypothetical protein
VDIARVTGPTGSGRFRGTLGDILCRGKRSPRIAFSTTDTAERCWSGRTGLTANSQGIPNKRLTGFHRFCLLLTELDTNQHVAGRIVATSVNN